MMTLNNNNHGRVASGFRLARLEIYNWGTFDGQIWPMTPNNQTAVLTGANGSGKSTVVDALLTLLVEGRQRNYNLASGTGSSRERSERTYVKGQYSRSRGESAVEGKANTLRGTESHSVLLAVFHDAAQDRTVTLAQILWLSNVDRVEKRYYVAPCELSIAQHFPRRHVTSRDLPKDVETFGSTFKDYIVAARKALGLGGRPKALDLFNQTVAVKDIASLNQFVRDHMLDQGDPEAQVEVLRSQYRELNDAHAAIQRAGMQLNILLPLVDAAKEYRRYGEQMARYEAAREIVPFYVADKAQKLIAQAMVKVQTQREAEQSRLTVVESEIASLRESLERVKIAIAQDSIGQMKREIESQLPALLGEINAIRRTTTQYDTYARRLGLPVYQHEDDFYQNRTQAQTMLTELETAIQTLEAERSEAQFEQRDLTNEAQDLDATIQYLRDNLSNIPAQVARIRQTISTALDIPPEELPFVGELLQVRPEDTAWEGALERLLHGFAQDLIVPEAAYPHLSRYVNAHNLRGRLVYRRVDPSRPAERLGESRGQFAPGSMAYDKLAIKADTPYHDWLAASLMQRFAYLCTETLDEFQQADRAITPQGQLKHSRSHHEKDDRHKVDDRRNYVLGWDNRAKLRQLELDRDNLQRRRDKLNAQIAQLSQDIKRRRGDGDALHNLLKVDTFAHIDWRTPQTEYDRLKQQLASLDDSKLRQLELERDTLKYQLDETNTKRDKIKGALTTLDNHMDNYDQHRKTLAKQLASLTDELRRVWEQVGHVIADIDKEPLTIEKVTIRSDELKTSLQRGIATFKGHQTQHETTILNAMHEFRREYPDAGASLTADIAALETYEDIYTRLKTDDLPKYEDRFKQMLDRTVTRGVMAFYSGLTEQERGIERSIAELNESLAQVDYGGGSIIRLLAERTPDTEINEFQRTLKACIPDAGDNSQEELERAYNRIKGLIERFDTDPNWMRRVIDVRRWRIFAAEQLDQAGRQVDYYNDSSGKSGGQKAKLAYTILASAIAHQYGLQDVLEKQKSFRFVVIDEAFSKLDDDNARFAMQLFGQLGLQLLVVTPMQQLHVIEDYVRAYHLVVNNTEGNDSRLFNLTQTEYHERRREHQAQGQLA